MPGGRSRKHRSLNILQRHQREQPVHSKEFKNFTTEIEDTAGLGIEDDEKSNSERSDDLENNYGEEKRDVTTVDSDQKVCLTEVTVESNDVNSESKISNVDEKDVADNKKDEELNFKNLDANLGDQPFTLKLNRRKRNLIKWSDNEKQVTEKFFRRHIKMRISPKKREVLQLMKLYPNLFKNRKWDVIKVYVCNKYNSKSKKIALSPVRTDSSKVESNGIPFVAVQSKENDNIYPFLDTEIKEESTRLIDPLLGENIPEEVKAKLKNITQCKLQAKKITVCPGTTDGQSTHMKKEQQTYSARMYSKRIMSSQKPHTLLDSKVMPANGKYLAVLKQLPQSGEASQEKKSLQNSQTTITSAGDNIVLKRLVFDTEKRCFRAVDSNELVNAMSKKIRVLSVNQVGIGKGMSSLNVLQKMPPSSEETECLEKQSSFMKKDILPVSTDDMCVLCARKRSPTHNISHLVNLIKDISGVNLSNLNFPLRACEECVADVNVTLKLRNSIKRAYEDLVKKDDTVTINVLPPKTVRQYGSPVNETDSIASEQIGAPTINENNQDNRNVSGDDSEIIGTLNEHSSDGFKKIKLLTLNDKDDNCGRERVSVDNYSKYHMNSDTKKICEQLCITNSSQKEHLRQCKKTDVICKVCNRSFRCLQNLRWHMRCHVYKCEVCCKTFVYGIAKKNHLKREHTEQEVQEALEDMRTDKETLRSFLPHSSRQIVTLNSKKEEEKKQIKVKEEEIDIKINELKEEIIL